MSWRALLRQNTIRGRTELPLNPDSLPIKEIANALAERAWELGLTWRLVPATVGEPGPAGTMRVTLDGDTTPIDATSMIGRLPVGGRVFVVLSPPAGVHVVGFMGADFPPSVAGEAIGRSRLIELATNWGTGANNTIPTNVTGMVFTAVAGGRYIVRLRASHGGTSAANIKYGWTAPSGAALDRYVLTIPPGETTNYNPDTFTSARRGVGDNQGAPVTSSTAPSTTFPGYWEDILVRMGSTAGAVQLRASQITTNAQQSIVWANSYMEVQRYR